MSQEARRAALVRVGARASIREQHRAARGLPVLETFGRDVRYALRTLRRSPGFASVAILSLALGIGANSAVFSAIDAVLVQPLPYPDGDRLMRLRQRQPRSAETNIAPIRLEDWNRLSSTFEAITGYYMDDVSDTSNDLPEKYGGPGSRPDFSTCGAWRRHSVACSPRPNIGPEGPRPLSSATATGAAGSAPIPACSPGPCGLEHCRSRSSADAGMVCVSRSRRRPLDARPDGRQVAQARVAFW